MLPHPDAGTPSPEAGDAESQRGDPRRYPGRWGLDSGGLGKETAGGQTLTPGSPGLDAPGQPPSPRPRPRSGLRGDQFSTFPLCASGALPKPRNPRFPGVQFRSPGHQLHPRLSGHPRFPPGEKEARGTEISPACAARRSLLQSPEPTLPALQRRPVSRLPAGCRLPSQRVRGAVRPGRAARTPGAPRL